MPKGRPGGNPDLVEYQFSTDREEPYTAKMTLRLPPSQYEKLKQLPKWQDKVREAIASLLKQQQQLEKGQLDSTTAENAIATKPTGATRHGGQTPADGTGEGTQEDQTGNTAPLGKSKRSPGTGTTTTKAARRGSGGN